MTDMKEQQPRISLKLLLAVTLLSVLLASGTYVAFKQVIKPGDLPPPATKLAPSPENLGTVLALGQHGQQALINKTISIPRKDIDHFQEHLDNAALQRGLVRLPLRTQGIRDHHARRGTPRPERPRSQPHRLGHGEDRQTRDGQRPLNPEPRQGPSHHQRDRINPARNVDHSHRAGSLRNPHHGHLHPDGLLRGVERTSQDRARKDLIPREAPGAHRPDSTRKGRFHDQEADKSKDPGEFLRTHRAVFHKQAQGRPGAPRRAT